MKSLVIREDRLSNQISRIPFRKLTQDPSCSAIVEREERERARNLADTWKRGARVVSSMKICKLIRSSRGVHADKSLSETLIGQRLRESH